MKLVSFIRNYIKLRVFGKSSFCQSVEFSISILSKIFASNMLQEFSIRSMSFWRPFLKKFLYFHSDLVVHFSKIPLNFHSGYQFPYREKHAITDPF